MAGKKKGEKAPKKDPYETHREKLQEKIAKAEARVKANETPTNLSADHVEKLKQSFGRPSNYDPAYKKIVVDVMKQGKSIAAVAALIGVPRTKIWKWAEMHDDFRDALELGKDLCQHYWEDLSQDISNGIASQCDIKSKGNPGMVQFLMARRFQDYYSRTQADIKSEVKQTHHVYVFESQLAGGVIRQKNQTIEENELDDIINDLSEDVCKNNGNNESE